MDFLELFREISSPDTVISQSLVFQKNKTARWDCFSQCNGKFWKSVNWQKKPYAAEIGVHKASTGFKIKNDDLQFSLTQLTKTREMRAEYPLTPAR